MRHAGKVSIEYGLEMRFRTDVVLASWELKWFDLES